MKKLIALALVLIAVMLAACGPKYSIPENIKHQAQLAVDAANDFLTGTITADGATIIIDKTVEEFDKYSEDPDIYLLRTYVFTLGTDIVLVEYGDRPRDIMDEPLKKISEMIG